MPRVAKLSADLTANTSSFETSLKKADRTLSNSSRSWQQSLRGVELGFLSVDKRMSVLSTGFTTLKTTMAGLLGGAGLLAIATSAIAAGSAIDDTAQRLQIGSTELQGYQYAAKLAGIENEQLENAVTKLNAKIADGTLHYKDANEGLLSIAEAVKKAKSDTERLAIVNDAFGDKIGAKMLPLLTGGAQGLKNFAAEAQRTGNVLSADTIKKTAAFGDELDSLGGTIRNNFAKGFLDELVGRSGELKTLYSDPEFAKGLNTIGTAFGFIAGNAARSAGELGSFVGKMHEFAAEYRSFSANLDKGFFSSLDSLDKKLGRNPVPTEAELIGKSNLGIKKDPSLRAQYDQQQAEMAEALKKAKPYQSSQSIKSGEDAAKKAAAEAKRRADQTADIFRGLQQETSQLQIQVGMYGQKESAIARASKELQISNRLTEAGITLSASQKAQLSDQLDKYGQLEEQQKRMEDLDRNRQQAMSTFAGSFESAFEDAIAGGEKLSDVIKGLTQDLVKMLVRSNITQPLVQAVTGSDFFSGIGNFLFGGSIPSHATGIDYVPRDMMARIHKGEAVIPASEAKAMRSGGGDVVVNITNNAGAKVSTSSSDTGSGTQLNVMIDQAVADNIARQGSKTNQALQAHSSRALVRR